MEFSTRTAQPAVIKSDCLILPISDKAVLGHTAKAVDEISKGAIKSTLALGDFTGKVGEAELLIVPGLGAKRILLLGCGKGPERNETKFNSILKACYNKLKSSNCKDAVLYLSDITVTDRTMDWMHRYACEVFAGAAYEFNEFKFKSKPKAPSKFKKLIWAFSEKCSPETKAAIKTGVAIASGASFAKDLANAPGNVAHPSYLADHAKRLGTTYDKLSVKVIDEKQLEKMGMGCFISVSKGSDQPGKLIIMEYKGGPKNQAPHVLVGKGITFDTGGISLKPGSGMDEMKYDMGGAASVFGTVKTVSELDIKLNIIGVVVAAENMPSGGASRPGDIVTSLSGQTVEILNTDAEGRLVLCDALTYVERFKPASVIDIATLTGACVVALGAHPCAMLSNNDQLAGDLLAAGKESHDRCWQMPLWEEYQSQLDTPFADMANIGGPKAGTITAACFLSRFTENYKWAHLDIAGVAWTTAPNKAATGRPVPLLTQYLLDRL